MKRSKEDLYNSFKSSLNSLALDAKTYEAVIRIFCRVIGY